MDSETLYYDTFEDVQEYIKNHERQYGVQIIRRTSSVGFANDASCSEFSCTIISLIRSFLTLPFNRVFYQRWKRRGNVFIVYNSPSHWPMLEFRR